MTSVCNVTLTSNDGGSPCVQTCTDQTQHPLGCPPGEDHLTFTRGVTLLLSHSNSSSKFQAEAGIVTALARARCWYRLGDDQYCSIAHVCIAGVNTYIVTIDGCSLQHMQPIVWADQ